METRAGKGRPLLISPDIKEKMRHIIHKDPEISSKNLLNKINNRFGVKLSMPILIKARQSIHFEQTTGKSRLKRVITADGSSPGKSVKMRRIGDNGKDSNDGEASVQSPKQSSSKECDGWHDGSVPSMTSPYSYDARTKDDDIAKQTGQVKDETVTSLESIIREINFDGSAAQADSETLGPSQLKRLENILASLVKSVSSLHTKVDLMYDIMAQRGNHEPSPPTPPTKSMSSEPLLNSGGGEGKESSRPRQPAEPSDDEHRNPDPEMNGIASSGETSVEGCDKAPSDHVAGAADDDDGNNINAAECSFKVELQEDGNSACAVYSSPQQYVLDRVKIVIGDEVLLKSSLTGCSRTERLNTEVLKEIKDDVIARFLADKSDKEKEQAWAACLLDIADYCESLRSACSRGSAGNTAACNEVARFTETQNVSTVPDEQDMVSIGGHPDVTLPRDLYKKALQSSLPNLYTLALCDLLFSVETLEKSTLTGFGGTEPLDPNIIAAIKDEVVDRFGVGKSSDESRTIWAQCQNSISSRCKNLRSKITPSGRLATPSNLASPTSVTASFDSSNDDVMDIDSSDWSVLSDDGNTEASTNQPAVSIGGDPIVTLSYDEYQQACKKTQPTLFATALADKIFGSELLKISTLTGKDRTNRLDPNIVEAIKNDVLNRFASDAPREDREQIWLNCQQSLANRCKMLRFKEKNARFQASLRRKQPLNAPLVRQPLTSNPAIPYEQERKQAIEVITDEETDSEDLEDVMIGDDPNVTMSLADYKVIIKNHDPKSYVIALAEKLFGRAVLAEYTVTGRSNTPKLDKEILFAIKADVIERFASDRSPAEQESLWYECLLCLSTRCRTLRYRTLKNSEVRPGQGLSETSDITSIIIRDDVSEEIPKLVTVGDEPGVTLTTAQYQELGKLSHCNKFVIALAEMLFGVETLSTARVTNNLARSQLDPKILRAIKSEIIKRFGIGMTPYDQEKLWSDSFTSIALKCRTLRCARQKPHPDTNQAQLVRTTPFNTQSRAVTIHEATGARITTAQEALSSRDSGVTSPRFATGLPEDSSRVIIGGDPSVTLPRHKFDSLRTAHPNKYAIGLAENLFGREIMARSTVTGQGRTSRLDEKILCAIKADVLTYFAADNTPAQQEQLWAACIQSIAAKCKTLRYAKKHSQGPFSRQPDEDMTNTPTQPEKMEVLVGGYQDVTLPLDEFRQITVEIEPSNYAVALAVRLFPDEVLERAAAGEGTRSLDDTILKAIKGKLAIFLLCPTTLSSRLSKRMYLEDLQRRKRPRNET
ncbi:uncharacterized protein LOC5512772 isoform X2 [Nematostella vectensis]|uniref:uncharacterized protein LOC5512772 isoform X2 n=1 Tax=Nematostella vectensis TaxID=45351 RepID=UPI00207749B2|nr:uncharacterized protein LOC5512772 isoform X2 [Nematostella vectensis]